MWFAAVEADGVDAALVTAVWAFLGIVVTTLGTLAVQAIRSRNENRSATAAPAPATNGNVTALVEVARDQGVHSQRLDDADEALDMQDKRIDRLERWAEHHDPEWWAGR